MKLQLRIEKIKPYENKFMVHYVIEDLDRKWFKVRKRDYICTSSFDKLMEDRLKDALTEFLPQGLKKEHEEFIGKTYSMTVLEKSPQPVSATIKVHAIQ